MNTIDSVFLIGSFGLVTFMSFYTIYQSRVINQKLHDYICYYLHSDINIRELQKKEMADDIKDNPSNNINSPNDMKGYMAGYTIDELRNHKE